jgi:MFS family permease
MPVSSGESAAAENLPRRRSGGLTRDSFYLAFASLFADISTEMLYPVLPVFLTQTLNASGSVVGLVEGTAQATQNIAQGFSGWLSERLRNRKAIALVGSLLSAVAKPLIGASTIWQGVLGARFLDRFGAGTRSAPRDALIAASVDESDRGKAFGLEGIGDNAGACLGPLLAVVLLSVVQLDMRLIFYLAVIPGLLAVCMIALVTERPAAQAKSPVKLGTQEFSAGYWRYLAVTALFGLGNSSNSFLILQTQDIGASLTTTILIYAAFNLVAALVSYPAGQLSDRWGRKSLMLAAFAVFLVAYLGFATTRSSLVIAALFAFYGAYQGTFRAVGKALATDYVPEHRRASAVGWYNTTVGLSGLVASAIAGLLWDRVGHAAVFLYGAGFAAIGGIALAVLVPARPAATSGNPPDQPSAFGGVSS